MTEPRFVRVPRPYPWLPRCGRCGRVRDRLKRKGWCSDACRQAANRWSRLLTEYWQDKAG